MIRWYYVVFWSDAMVWGECWWLFPLQVEMLRSQLGDHEQSCAFRLVNCVDLACQQRIPVSRCSIVRVATKTKTWTGNTIIESGCWPTWTTTTRLRTSLGLREAPTAATSLWMRSDSHDDHSGNNDNVYKCMKWVYWSIFRRTSQRASCGSLTSYIMMRSNLSRGKYPRHYIQNISIKYPYFLPLHNISIRYPYVLPLHNISIKYPYLLPLYNMIQNIHICYHFTIFQ